MSDNQAVWKILWDHAQGEARPGEPFEIDDVVPAASEALGVIDDRARRLIGGLLVELARLPDGRQYFRREGDAVVALPEFFSAPRGPGAAEAAYPYEL
jgi:hypothetical protein